MIELTWCGEAADIDLEGRIVFGGLDMPAYGVFFPGTAVYVCSDGPRGLVCDRMGFVRSDGEIIDLARIDAGPAEAVRMPREKVRFVCDTGREAAALLALQWPISELVAEKAGRMSGTEITHEIRQMFEQVVAEAEMGAEPAEPALWF